MQKIELPLDPKDVELVANHIRHNEVRKREAVRLARHKAMENVHKKRGYF